MPIQSSDGKTAVGVFVDGLELKFVRLSLKGSRVVLREFKSAVLVSKLEDKQGSAQAREDASFGDTSDAFSTAAPQEAPSEEGTNNPAVLLSLLGDLGSTRRYTFSYSIAEPAVTYQEMESDWGLKGDKLNKRIVQELTATRAMPPAPDAVSAIPTASGGILSVVREDGLHVFGLLSELRSFLGGSVPKINVIGSSDLCMMEFVRMEYSLQPDEVSVIVYVGNDFTRIIFMQGTDYLHYAPIISEGHESPNIENTIYSRILLEQDNIALTRIDRIFLAGESHKINLLESLGPQFSSASVEYLTSSSLDITGYLGGQIGNAVSEYVVPIITAWKALKPKGKGLYDVNLVPMSIIEGQKAFKLAWHGWIVALMIIGSIVFSYTSILSRVADIRRARDELAQKQTKLAELDVFRQRKDQLNADISRFSMATAIYDSIAPGGDRWSRILHYLANSVEDLNSLWIKSIKPDDQNPRNLLISGRSLYRSRIERIAGLFESATLREVRTIEIRKKVLYEFDIVVEKVDKHDIPEPAFQTGRR